MLFKQFFVLNSKKGQYVPKKVNMDLLALMNLREHENPICLSREARPFKMLIHLSSIHLKVPLSITLCVLIWFRENKFI